MTDPTAIDEPLPETQLEVRRAASARPPLPTMSGSGRRAGLASRCSGAAHGACSRLGHRASWGLVIVLGIIFLVFLHEMGHFLAAKRAGMKVTEFFIGFGPRIWSFTRGETEYGIKVAPLGAYVKIIGMNNLEEVPIEDEARTYRQKSLLRPAARGGRRRLRRCTSCRPFVADLRPARPRSSARRAGHRHHAAGTPNANRQVAGRPRCSRAAPVASRGPPPPRRQDRGRERHPGATVRTSSSDSSPRAHADPAEPPERDRRAHDPPNGAAIHRRVTVDRSHHVDGHEFKACWA